LPNEKSQLFSDVEEASPHVRSKKKDVQKRGKRREKRSGEGKKSVFVLHDQWWSLFLQEEKICPSVKKKRKKIRAVQTSRKGRLG